MEAFADESVNEVSCMCSAQSAKTLTMLCLLAWVIAEDPGPILWVTSSMQEAKKICKSRLIPLLEKCAPVAAKFPRERGRKTTCEIYFVGAPLIVCGSESEASLQSTPFRYIFLDEARSYPPGAVEMVSERTTSYTHNYKRVFISTPDMEKDAVHVAFLAGDQRHYEVRCPNDECRHFQELLWKEKDEKGGLKWETNETTKPEGRYDFDKLAATIRYECERCGHHIRDTPTERKQLTMPGNGRWIVHNPNAPSNHRSFTWNKLLPYWPSWAKQVFSFLAAKQALGWNNYHPMKDHINEHRGLPWTDRLRYAADEKFIHLRADDYDPKAVWPGELRRFATLDVQGKGGRHFWVVIRAWGRGASSRLLYFAKLWSIEEVRQMIEEWDVSPDNVGIDSATFTSEVYKYVVESGYRWKAMKGDDRPYFKVADRNFIFTRSRADPAIGTAMQGRVRPIDLYIWSKPSALDRLTLFQNGMSGDWRIYKNVADEYAQQVTAYERRERMDIRGVTRTEWHKKRDDHIASCEMEQIICAAATDILSAPADDMPLFHRAM